MKKLFWLSAAVAALLAAGYFLWFQKKPTCTKGELRFETPQFSLGTTYNVPGQIYSETNGFSVGIEDIIVPPQTLFISGEIQTNPPHPFGNGQMIQLNNAVLNFDLRQNTRKVEFEYLVIGGAINFGAAQSAKLHIATMSSLPGSINGVAITRSNVVDITNAVKLKIAEKGTITLTSKQDIGGLIIGGQEMFLDNFCFN